MLSPTATLSETSFDIAFGTPIEDIVSRSAYIWYPPLYIAFPSSPNPFLFVRYTLYTKPSSLIKSCDTISTNTLFIKPSVLLLLLSAFMLISSFFLLIILFPIMLLYNYIIIFIKIQYLKENYIDLFSTCIAVIFLPAYPLLKRREASSFSSRLFYLILINLQFLLHIHQAKGQTHINML